MTTTITAAARTITRDINTTAPEVKTYYAADGTLIQSMPADMWLTNGHPEDAAIILTGRKGNKITQREVQDRLDAHAATGQISGPDFEDALGSPRY